MFLFNRVYTQPMIAEHLGTCMQVQQPSNEYNLKVHSTNCGKVSACDKDYNYTVYTKRTKFLQGIQWKYKLLK